MTTKNKLPNFAIIGAMRAGTTTLYEILRCHPDISMSRQKETDFFIEEKNWHQGLGWYTSQFDSSKPIRGEVSPNYTKRETFRSVPERMSTTVPDIKLVYVVRDPIKRAISHFSHLKAHGARQDLSLLDLDKRTYKVLLETSSYAMQLAPYLELFPEDNIRVLDFDLFYRDPNALVGELYELIGARQNQVEEIKPANSTASFDGVPRTLLYLGQLPFAKYVHPNIRSVIKSTFRRKPRLHPDAKGQKEFKEQLAKDLAQDISRFREMTNMAFDSWEL